jgi:ankyrin repeat protein
MLSAMSEKRKYQFQAITLILAAFLLISACSPYRTGTEISQLNALTLEPKKDLGQLIIYRPFKDGHTAHSTLTVDGQMIADPEVNPLFGRACGHGETRLFNIPAGRYEISLKTYSLRINKNHLLKNETLAINVDRNDRSYVKCSVDDDKFPILLSVPSGVGEEGVFGAETMLLRSTYDLESGYAEGGETQPPLHQAVGRRNPKAVEHLIKAGADIHAPDLNGDTPLHMAVELGPPETVRMLIDAGADIEARDGDGNSSLHKIIVLGPPENILLLIDAGADIHASNGFGDAPLHMAVRHGKPEIAQVLIDAGVDINVRDGLGNAALHLAIEHGYSDIVDILTDAGADIASLNENAKTPLHLAAELGPPETVRMLIDTGADIHAPDGNGEAPLQLAIKNKNPDIVQMVIDAGADIASRSKNGKTPLHLAAELGPPETVQMLIDAGAEIEARDVDGNTPLNAAAKEGTVKTVEALIAADAELNSRNRDGDTPLHSSSAHYWKVDVLLEAGANPSLLNNKGKDPLTKKEILAIYAVAVPLVVTIEIAPVVLAACLEQGSC